MPRRMSKTCRQSVVAREREQKAFELRKAGFTYQMIAKALGVSKQAAHQAVGSVLSQLRTLTETDAQDVRRLEIERLDAMHLGLWQKARSGDLQAVDREIKIQERRSYLLGLDAPKKLEGQISSTGSVVIYLPDNGRGPSSSNNAA